MIRRRNPQQPTAALLADLPRLFGDEAHLQGVPREYRGLTTVLQPVVDLKSGRLIGAEALSRFPNAPGADPGEVFRRAAASRTNEPLELAALASALTLLPQLPAEARLYVNASPAVAAGRGAHELLRSVELQRLVLELTEHGDTDIAQLLHVLRPLRAQGLAIAMDDLGAGHSRLTRLVTLRPDIVKLDRGLTAGVHRDPYRQAVVRSLVAMAAETGTRVIAEGVECREQAETLSRLDVRYGQGFFLGRPDRPARALAAWLAGPRRQGSRDRLTAAAVAELPLPTTAAVPS
jgi:EAL domain-containing protein (putative c-di-GMP-specific phosphodiesterase class I)